MLSAVGNYQEKKFIGFYGEKKEKSPYDEDTLLKNDFSTRTRISMNKITKAFTVYPAKGLIGSKNSNFYEFLTMGSVPYIVGSLTLMSVFNSANKYFKPFARSKAAKLGNKMALGVLFYGIMKEVSKSFINKPVKWITGIDTELPYAKVNKLIQESPNEDDKNPTSTEYHKVGESVDFPRWDLLYGNPEKGEKINFRYDKIAKKNGFGENLTDSDQEIKPLYKEVLIKSKFAKSISTYLWAAVGVALAMQEPWDEFLKSFTLKFWQFENFKNTIKQFGKSFVDSSKALFNGSSKSFLGKQSGKLLIAVATLSTMLGLANTLNIKNKPSKVKASDVLKENKESVVG